MMWFSTILVCAAMTLTPEGNCDPSNVIWSSHSRPIFLTQEECKKGAMVYFHSNLSEIRDKMNDTEQYRIEMFCGEENKNTEEPQIPPPIQSDPIQMPRHKT